VSQWSESFTDTFIMRQGDSSWGNFTSSNSFHFQVTDLNNSTLIQSYIYNFLWERNLGFENLTILYRKSFDLSIIRPDSIVSYRVFGFRIFCHYWMEELYT
jgi:hypothetical protein